MEFDSVEWRASRDRLLHTWVQDPHAVAFILMVADAGELWDDLIDRDTLIQDADVHRVFFNLLTELPLNPFFDRHKWQLTPLLLTGANAWLDANELEKGHRNHRVFAYVMRDFYMEFVSFVIYLTRGRQTMRELSMEIRDFFTHHESLEEYLEELS